MSKLYRFISYITRYNSSQAWATSSYFLFRRPPQFIRRPQRLTFLLLRRRVQLYTCAFKFKNQGWSNRLWLLLITYFNWVSLDGLTDVRGYFVFLLKQITNYEYARFIFRLINFGDWFFWRWWFVLTNHDLRTEYLKQAYFLHHHTGNLMFMFQLGLPGGMYQEWLQNPISGRKQPVWFYLRWRWRYQWHPQWLTISARLVYRRTFLYRWRDFILNQTSRSNLVYKQYFTLLVNQRYRPVISYYYQFRQQLNLYLYNLATAKINHHQIKKRQTHLDRAQLWLKKKQKETRWLKKYPGHHLTKDFRRRSGFERGLKKIRRWLSKIGPSSTFHSYAVVNPDRWYTDGEPPLVDITSRHPLTTHHGVDDVDFFGQDSPDFEDQQDDNDDEGDETNNYDYLFGLRRDIDSAGRYRWYETEPEALTRSGFTPLTRRRRYRLSRWQRRRRWFRRDFDEFISFNHHRPTVFDSEVELPPGDGPNVVDDDGDATDGATDFAEVEYGPLRRSKLIDWFWLRSDNLQISDRAIPHHWLDRVWFWYSTQYQRGVDRNYRQMFAQMRTWVNRWSWTGKRRYTRENPKWFSRNPWRYNRQWRRIRRLRRGHYRRTKLRWEIFNLYNAGDENFQKVYSLQGLPPEHRPYEVIGYDQRNHPRMHQRFLSLHRQHLENEPYYKHFYPKTNQRSRLYYYGRHLLDRVRQVKDLDDKLQSYKATEKKTRELPPNAEKNYYRRFELLFNFYRPPPKTRWNSFFVYSRRYYNNRPIPRRGLQPPKHYPKYQPVYNASRKLSQELTGDQKYARFNSFWATSVPGIGLILALITVLAVDDFWYQYDWGRNQLYLFDSEAPVYRWANFVDPQWWWTEWSRLDFERTPHLLARDGYQHLWYPSEVYNGDLNRPWRPGLLGHHRLNHFMAFPVYESVGLFPGNTTVGWLAGKGLKDWILVTGQVHWLSYYSPVAPVVGDRYYWMANQLTNSRYEYLIQQPLDQIRWQRLLFRYFIFFNRFLSIELELLNTWNITSYNHYLFHPPRAIFGQTPVKLAQRSELIYQPILKNYLNTHQDLFTRHSLHYLGLDFFNFSRRPQRFNQWVYTSQLPLWESHLNGLFIDYQLNLTNQVRPPVDITYPVSQVYNLAVDFFNYYYLVGAYFFRIFLIFVGPFYFLTVYRRRWLSNLIYFWLPPVQQQISHRSQPVMVNHRWLTGHGQDRFDHPTNRYWRHLFPRQIKGGYRAQRNLLLDGITGTQPYEILFGYTFIKKKYPLRVTRWLNLNRRRRRVLHRYRSIYHSQRWRGASPLYSVIPEEFHFTRSILNRYAGQPRRLRHKFNRFQPVTPPTKLNLGLPKGYPRRVKKKTPQPKRFIRPSLLMANQTKPFIQPRATRYYRVRPVLSFQNWLITTRQTQLKQTMLDQAHPGETNRRRQRQRRHRYKEANQLYEDDPWLMMVDYDHFEESTMMWRLKRRYRKRRTYHQAGWYRASPGDDERNLHQPETPVIVKTQRGLPPRWVAQSIQHRYHLHRYQTGVNVSLVQVTPGEPHLTEQFYRQLGNLKFGHYLIDDLVYSNELTNDYDHTDLDEYCFGSDNSDENESELTLEEHDSLFDEPDQYYSVGSNLSVGVTLAGGLAVEQRRRHLLVSYRRWRSLPVEYYQLQPPAEIFSLADQPLSEWYCGPLSVDHPGYHQLSLTSYQIPKIYRRPRPKEVKVNGRFNLRRPRRYGFRWTPPPTIKLRRRGWRRHRRHSLHRRWLPSDYPVCKPWVTVDHQPPVDFAQLTLDYTYQMFSAKVDYPNQEDWWVQENDCLNFFDYSLSYNLGYRYSGEHLYSLLTFRPVETELSVLTQPYTVEHGFNTYRELIPEDLNYEPIKDYESCYLEFLCGEYFEGYSWFWFILEDNTDFSRWAGWYLEDHDEIDEWDDLSETPSSDHHLPRYLPVYALQTAVGQPRSVDQRLTPVATTVYEGYHRMPNVYWRKNYSLKNYAPTEVCYHESDVVYKINSELSSIYQEMRHFFPRRRWRFRYVQHELMLAGVDPANQILSDRDYHHLLLKMWCLADTYYGDIYQGYTTNY